MKLQLCFVNTAKEAPHAKSHHKPKIAYTYPYLFSTCAHCCCVLL